MEKSDSIAKLAVALVAAQAELKVVEKEAINPFFKSKYADLPAIVKEYQRVFPKHGLAVTQIPEGAGLRTTIVHISGEFISSVADLKPVKNDPQAIGSAITYMRRYALAAVCGIVAAEDDDDGNAASEPKTEHKMETKEQRQDGEIITAEGFIVDIREPEGKNPFWSIFLDSHPDQALSTKKSDMADFLKKSSIDEKKIRITFDKVVKGRFTNRYIISAEAINE